MDEDVPVPALEGVGVGREALARLRARDGGGRVRGMLDCIARYVWKVKGRGRTEGVSGIFTMNPDIDRFLCGDDSSKHSKRET